MIISHLNITIIIPEKAQKSKVCQSCRPRFSSLEAASYPREGSDAEGIKVESQGKQFRGELNSQIGQLRSKIHQEFSGLQSYILLDKINQSINENIETGKSKQKNSLPH